MPNYQRKSGNPGFWRIKFMIFMILCDLIIPLLMLFSGIMMQKHCPKKINGIVGYRTTRSMKNSDTWKFANEYCGRLWCKIGLLLTAPSCLILILVYRSDNTTQSAAALILMAVQCIALIASIFPTESALKKTFHADGTRK